MRLSLSCLATLTGLVMSLSFQGAYASESSTSSPGRTSSLSSQNFAPFTAKVCRDKVRLRTKPHLGASVVRELDKGAMLVVREQEDEFYAVEPPSDMEGYVYRTFVLDGAIEGANVNVRLGPGTDHPVVAQLNTGDVVQGSVARENTKWLKIQLPQTARFFVAKEYLDNVGGPEMLTQWETKRSRLVELFEEACVFSNRELEKPFNAIAFDEIRDRYQHIIDNYGEFATEASNAKELLLLAQDAYLQKKIQFLEEKAQQTESWVNHMIPTTPQNAELRDFQEHSRGYSEDRYPAPSQDSIAYNEPEEEYFAETVSTPRQRFVQQRPEVMTSWDEAEDEYFARWAAKTGVSDRQLFYRDEELSSTRLSGIVEAYHRPIKNKPGNFLLRNSKTQLPEAYLYSTTVNLQDLVGKNITIVAVERPNNHFAFPAYFVLSCE